MINRQMGNHIRQENHLPNVERFGTVRIFVSVVQVNHVIQQRDADPGSDSRPRQHFSNGREVVSRSHTVTKKDK